MRSKLGILTIAVAAFVLASCQRHEASPTAGYGDRVVAGQVVMASSIANGSPAGVEVSVVGTGMSTTLGADGRFTFIGVPDNAELTFRRSDGINARVHASDANALLELSTTGATKTSSKRRGASPNDPGPHQEIEGTITDIATDGSSITVHDSHGNDVKVALTSTTLIRKGDKVVKATDLAKGDRVHVKASTVNNVLTASQVVVQEPDDDNNNPPANQTQEIEGTVVTATASSIEVLDSHGKDVTAAITSTTVVRKGDMTVDPTTLKKGDRVHVKATMVNGTLTATEVIVQDTGDDNGNAGNLMEAHGTVKSVGTSSIVVTTKNGDVMVNTDSNTIIQKDDQKIALTDIKTGDQVEAAGTKVDSTTMLAKMIEVQGDSHH